MSEMLPTEINTPSTLNRGRAPFRSLRLLIAPAYPSSLIVSLVVLPHNGHPTLHPRIRQLETRWFPQDHQDDLESYALSTAFLRVAQTGH